MNYLSLEFIILLVATLIIFYVWPKKYIRFRYVVLLVASYVFIGFHDWRFVLVVLVNTLVSFFGGVLTQNIKEKPKKLKSDDTDLVTYFSSNNKKANPVVPTIISIVFNIGLLLVVKYTNWLGEALLGLLDKPFSPINFIVPLGISFYTFTLVAYNIDVYKEKFPVEKNFLKFASFVSFFPKLIQGPIVSYNELVKEKEEGTLFSETTFRDINFLKPFQRFIFGLFKKVLIADILGVYVTYIWENINSVPGYYFVLVAILYAIQLYCDFSGYIDMSLGIAGLFGIKLPENFNVPYLSKTVQEFWGRWHISLGKWLRDYIYIPLGGNRVSKPRWVINILIVWLISGFWHGASWTYVLWGLYLGLLLAISGLLKPKLKQKFGKFDGKIANSLRVVRTFILITIGWSIFSAPDLTTFLSFGKRFILNTFDGSFLSIFNSSTLPIAYLIMALCIVVLCVVFYYFNNIKNSFKKIFSIPWLNYSLGFVFISLTLVSAIYMILVMNGLGVSSSGFIYFDF